MFLMAFQISDMLSSMNKTGTSEAGSVMMFFLFVRALLATFFYQNLPCDQPFLNWPQMGSRGNMWPCHSVIPSISESDL